MVFSEHFPGPRIRTPHLPALNLKVFIHSATMLVYRSGREQMREFQGIYIDPREGMVGVKCIIDLGRGQKQETAQLQLILCCFCRAFS